MPELQAAIEGAGVYIDILAFDACNMGAVEVAYEVERTGLVGILVGSEETIPMNGFPFNLMLTPVATDPARTPVQVATGMVDGWEAYYDPLNWAQSVCLSAIDIVSLGQQASVLDDWCAAMHAKLESYEKTYKKVIRDTYTMYATSKHLDLEDLCENILANSKITDAMLRAASADVISLVDSSVITYWNVPYAAACGGISIYWRVTGDWTTYGTAYSTEVAFAIDTGWADFLADYNLSRSEKLRQTGLQAPLFRFLLNASEGTVSPSQITRPLYTVTWTNIFYDFGHRVEVSTEYCY